MERSDLLDPEFLHPAALCTRLAGGRARNPPTFATTAPVAPAMRFSIWRAQPPMPPRRSTEALEDTGILSYGWLICTLPTWGLLWAIRDVARKPTCSGGGPGSGGWPWSHSPGGESAWPWATDDVVHQPTCCGEGTGCVCARDWLCLCTLAKAVCASQGPLSKLLLLPLVLACVPLYLISTVRDLRLRAGSSR